MFLAKLCPFLPIIWKLFWLVGWPVLLLWWCLGEGSFRCSLNLSQKVLEVTPMYSSSQVRSPHWNQYMAPLMLTMGLCPWGRPADSWWCYYFEVGLYAIPPTDLFNAFAETLCIGYNYMVLGYDFIGSGLGACGALVVSPISYFPGGPVEPFLHLVQSPLGVFTLGECLPEMIHFFVEKLRIATHCFDPMGEGN